MLNNLRTIISRNEAVIVGILPKGEFTLLVQSFCGSTSNKLQ